MISRSDMLKALHNEMEEDEFYVVIIFSLQNDRNEMLGHVHTVYTDCVDVYAAAAVAGAWSETMIANIHEPTGTIQ